jgi:hypothetical protein
VSYKSKEGDGLRTLVLKRCSQSLHCAMKYVWYFSAMSDWCESPMKERCLDLSRLCEVAVVNSALPDLSPSPSPTRKENPLIPVPDIPMQHSDDALEMDESNDSLKPISKMTFQKVKPDLEIDTLSRSQLESEMKKRLSMATLENKSPVLSHDRPELSAELDQVLEPETAPVSRKNSNDLLNHTSTDILIKSSSPKTEEKHAAAPTTLIRSHSATNLSSVDDHEERRLSKSPEVIHPHSKEFARFLAKQKRSETFTAQLDLLMQLEIISRKLKKVTTRDQRKDHLRKFLTVLDFKIMDQNLYIPNCRASEAHHRILRFVAEDAIPLSSREKVPFLVYMEVLHTGKTCSDADIFGDDSDDDESKEQFESKNFSESRLKLEKLKSRSKGVKPVKFKGTSKLGRPFGELIAERKERIRKKSPHGKLEKWDLHPIIVKVGDDCRQEALAVQMIIHINDIFKEAQLPLKLRPFNILITSSISGIVELVPDTQSVDSLKKMPNFVSLIWFFENHFGPRGSKEFEAAQLNFTQSIAAYSLITYLLQIKDRHNGNILIDAQGHVVHIDFGFFLSNSPGGNWGFEQAPFKLTQEYVEVMEGEDSECFNNFKLFMIRGFLELRRHADKLVSLASLMLKGPTMPCFYTGQESINQLRARFYADKTEQECIQYVYTLIEDSVNNWRSVEYDRYQKITNGIN